MNVYHLENGIRLGHINNESNIVHMSMVFGFGSRDESDSEFGITHLYEHLIMAKLRKRIYNLEWKGAVINAFSDWETISFNVSVKKEYWRSALRFFMAILTDDFIFSKQLVSKEIEVLKEELRFRGDWYDELLRKLFSNYKESEMEFSLFQLDDEMQNTLRFLFSCCLKSICVSGEIEKDFLCESIGSIKLPPSIGVGRSLLIPGKKVYEVHDFGNGESSVALTIPGPGAKNYKKLVFEMLITFLAGENSISRLFSDLRLRNQLIYSYQSEYILFEEIGVFLFQYDVLNENIYKSLSIINSNLKRLSNGISAKTLERLKEYFIGIICIQNEVDINQVSLIAEEILTGLHKPIEQKIADVKNVSLADINDFAKHYFSDIQI